MASEKTSFQKKSRGKFVNISGTRPSIHNNQLLTSSGIPSLDNVIGGGLAIGTVTLIEEDVFGSYGKMMLKYFIAEGVMNKHEVFLASGDIKPESLLEELPGPVLDDPGDGLKPGSGDNDMKIAWRYQNQPQVQSGSVGMRFGHYYDLTKIMDKELIANTKQQLVDVSGNEQVRCTCGSDQGLLKPAYASVLRSLKKYIDLGNFSTNIQQLQQRNVLRIGLHSIGSPQWGEDGYISHDKTPGVTDPSLCRFLYALRALMRSAYACCLITVPSHLFQDHAFIRRIEHLCDIVVRLESFVGSDKETNPVFRDYHGLFHIVKLPRLNTLTCHMPDTLDLAFKLRKKKFMIEKLHLPPELSDTVSRSQEEAVLPKSSAGTSSCGTSSRNTKLDF